MQATMRKIAKVYRDAPSRGRRQTHPRLDPRKRLLRDVESDVVRMLREERVAQWPIDHPPALTSYEF